MGNVPQHVAIILDGNGRWAKAKGMPRNYGHAQGAKNVETICRAAYDMGIHYITMYAFSTENWKRPQDEVDALMKLLDTYIASCMKTAKRDNMRVRIIGDKTALSPSLQEHIRELEEYSKEFTGLQLTIAVNYGGRDDIVRALKKVSGKLADGSLDPEDVTEDLISKNVDTWDIPDPDLLIRTCGEQRVSNFLLWQIAYSEFYFAEVAWPDFTPQELQKAIDAYGQRERRFGKL
ncbi:MAG: isoprenyl transferase [Lachnospiraceae bacterium]|nr:isoprenyl transferase [Lachnospiraceae bacterium]